MLLSQLRRARRGEFGRRLSLQFLEERIEPAQFVVTSAADDGSAGTLRSILATANTNDEADTITFAAGITTITLATGHLTISEAHDLTIDGGDAVTINGAATASATNRHFDITASGTAGVLLRKLVLQKGRISNGAGGALLIRDQAVTLESVTIRDCTALSGGAIGCISPVGAKITILNSNLTQNKATYFGGAVSAVEAASVLITNTLMDQNQATTGGALRLNSVGSLQIGNCTFTFNKSTQNGGSIYHSSPSLSLAVSDTTFTDNHSAWYGGAFFENGQSKITFSKCAFARNTASEGSGIYCGKAELTARDCRFFDHVGTAIKAELSPTVSLDSCQFTNNIGDVGAYEQDGGALTITASTFANNIADVDGGAIQVSYALTAIRNTTFYNNKAARYGGALSYYTVANDIPVQLSFFNCTVTDNSAKHGGGAIHWYGSSSISIHSSIIANNSVAGEQLDLDRITRTIVGSHNLFGTIDTSLVSLGPGNDPTLVGTPGMPVNPQLLPFGNYGSDTLIRPLSPLSPAINKGSNPLNLTFDQRGPGYPRQAGIAPDIGSFEFPLPPVVNGITIDDGSVQRSMLSSVTVTFSEAVTFPAGVASAFQLQRIGPGGPTGTVNVVGTQNGNVVTLTFEDAVFAAGNAKSLIDGRYTLTINASKIQGTYASLDGNGDGIAGGDVTTNFHRLFGDSDGDGRVSAVDFNAFRLALTAPSNVFDFNADGVVGAVDFQQFRLRYGMAV